MLTMKKKNQQQQLNRGNYEKRHQNNNNTQHIVENPVILCMRKRTVLLLCTLLHKSKMRTEKKSWTWSRQPAAKTATIIITNKKKKEHQLNCRKFYTYNMNEYSLFLTVSLALAMYTFIVYIFFLYFILSVVVDARIGFVFIQNLYNIKHIMCIQCAWKKKCNIDWLGMKVSETAYKNESAAKSDITKLQNTHPK